MKLKKVESFLGKLSFMFRRYYLDMRLQYDYSEDESTVQVTLSKVEKASGVSLVPSAIFSVTENSVRFLKLDFSSQIDYIDYEVSSFFELRSVILTAVHTLVQADHPGLSLFDFMSKIFSAKIEDPKSFMVYLLKVNAVDHSFDNDSVYVYDYGNFLFYKDAISFFSTQSARVVYRIDSELSGYNVVCLSFDALYGATDLMDAESEAKFFETETFEFEEPIPEQTDDMGFSDMGGDFGDEGMGGEGGASNSFPVEGEGAPSEGPSSSSPDMEL